MKRILAVVLMLLMVMSTTGCANGPLGRFFRGGACSTCTPPANRLFNWRGNSAHACESGACNTGVVSDPYQMSPAAIGTGIQPGQSGYQLNNPGGYTYPGPNDLINGGFVNPPGQPLPGPTGGGQ